MIVIANACIWGFALVMTSFRLTGTGMHQQIQLILGGSAAASLLVVGLGAIRMPKEWESRSIKSCLMALILWYNRGQRVYTSA